MNLGQIRGRLEDALTFAPGVQNWRDQVRERVNDALAQLVMSQRWTWRVRWHEIHWPADQTYADTACTPGTGAMTIAITSGLNASVVHLVPTWNHGVLDLSEHTGTSYTQAEAGGGPGQAYARFAVERVVNQSNQLVVSLSEFPGAALTSGSNVYLRVYRVVLPWDCAEVVQVVDRDNDRGPLVALPRELEARAMMNDDETGTPSYWMVDPAQRHHGFRQYGDSNQMQIRRWGYTHIPPPWTNDFAAASGAGGDLPNGTYQHRYTWAFAGLESAPSEIVTTTLSGANATINLSGMETALSTQPGRYRYIYRRLDEGPWKRVGAVTDPTVETFADATYAPALYQVQARDLPLGRQRSFIRLWPRPSSTTRLDVQYLGIAVPLEHDGDEVEMVPPDVQPWLVHRVAADLAAQSDNDKLARFHEARASELLHHARRRYLGGTAHRAVRRSIHGDDGELSMAVTSITWTG